LNKLAESCEADHSYRNDHRKFVFVKSHNSLPASPVLPPMKKGALTHALNQALVCLARTLSARPVGACFKRCLASEITSFDSDSSRSRKLFVVCFLCFYF
jgi:hypothetical protein